LCKQQGEDEPYFFDSLGENTCSFQRARHPAFKTHACSCSTALSDYFPSFGIISPSTMLIVVKFHLPYQAQCIACAIRNIFSF